MAPRSPVGWLNTSGAGIKSQQQFFFVWSSNKRLLRSAFTWIAVYKPVLKVYLTVELVKHLEDQGEARGRSTNRNVLISKNIFWNASITKGKELVLKDVTLCCIFKEHCNSWTVCELYNFDDCPLCWTMQTPTVENGLI